MSENGILERLLEVGKITREDIYRISLRGANRSLNKCADLMHSFLCGKDHIYDVDQKFPEGAEVCTWYMEQEMDDEWSQEEHQVWLKGALAEMKRQEMTDVEDLREFLINFRGILNMIIAFREKFPKGVYPLAKVIHDFYTATEQL